MINPLTAHMIAKHTKPLIKFFNLLCPIMSTIIPQPIRLIAKDMIKAINLSLSLQNPAHKLLITTVSKTTKQFIFIVLVQSAIGNLIFISVKKQIIKSCAITKKAILTAYIILS